jgi:hypothetical protein
VLLDFKLKQKEFFLWPKYLPTLGDVICKLKKLEKLIFVSKNWPNELKIGCKFPSNLLEFFEKDVNLEKHLEKFESEFERDEVVDV